MKPRKITQRDTLALVRKPLPPARKVILDDKTKARRKRVKLKDVLEGYQTPCQFIG